MRNVTWAALSVVSATLGFLGCSADDDAPGGQAGGGAHADGGGGARVDASGGSSGSAGAAGSSKGGSPGTGGSGGAAGKSGSSGGTAGTGAGGAAGTSGAGGAGGDAGAAGSGGAAGDAGAAGNGGAAGSGGGSVDAGPDAPTCVREVDTVFCSRQRKNCGDFNGVDNCGAPYKTNCGICVDQATCGGSGTLNVCSGDTPVNRAQGGTITASVATDNKATEDHNKVFDNDINTKWYVNTTATPWIAYQFAAGATYAITVYTVTSANDTPGRDPSAWRLEGTNDPSLTNWTVLDTRTGQTFASRFQTNTYVVSNTTAYAAYRFFVTANAGTNKQFQVSEIQLFDIASAVRDAGVLDAAGEGGSSEGGSSESGINEDSSIESGNSESGGQDAGTDASSSDDATNAGGSDAAPE